MILALAFYMFASIAIASAVMVISSKNPVHSVLFLILAFFNVGGLFILIGAEFLAMILVVVYVGAVAVLFMFVVMMLDINFVELRQGFLQYLPMGGLVGFILVLELVGVLSGWHFSPAATHSLGAPAPDPAVLTNTHALGQVLYTKYIYLFEASGMVLLVAMIGAIVLANRKRSGVRKQVIADQVARRAEETVKLVKVPTGKGI